MLAEASQLILLTSYKKTLSQELRDWRIRSRSSHAGGRGVAFFKATTALVARGLIEVFGITRIASFSKFTRHDERGPNERGADVPEGKRRHKNGARLCELAPLPSAGASSCREGQSSVVKASGGCSDITRQTFFKGTLE